MQSFFAKIGTTILVSLMATQSFAGGGQIGSAETLTGTYVIQGPTNDPGDENVITFTGDGTVYLAQKSVWGNVECEGKFQIQGRLLKAAGSCAQSSTVYSKFEMSIDLSEVSDLGYFHASVLNTKIYPKQTYMSFMRK